MTPLHIETFNGGLARGIPSVGLIIELPPERRAAVLAQTSMKLFQLAAGATYVRYGDMTGGGRVQTRPKTTSEISVQRSGKR